MKIVYLSLICLLLQVKPDPVERTVGLLRQNNLQELNKSIAPGIELTLLNEGNIYSKEQAQVIVDNFFTRNPVVAVKLIHKVDSNPAYQFGVMLITCKSGSYRVAVSLRDNNGTYFIDELRIEEEKAQQ